MFRTTVSDVFFIRGRGLVATGQIEAGPIRLGDQILVNGDRQVRVDGIEMFRKRIDAANAGDNVGLLVAGLDKADVKAGDVLTDVQSPASRQPHRRPWRRPRRKTRSRASARCAKPA